MKAYLLIASLIAAAIAAPALAQNGGVFALAPAERFKATDKNSDGKVTEDEFALVIQPDARGFIDNIWDNRDTNKDGWLTPEEMNANSGGRAGRGGAVPGGAAAAAAAAAARGGAPRGGPAAAQAANQ